MSRSTFTLAAAALAVTAAAFDAGSKNNVAIYWGQGDNAELTTVCADPSIDIVNIAFMNGFPTEVGGLPKSNFANSCGWNYPDPKTGKEDTQFLRCPDFEAGIKVCHSNSKKVMLSLGGGLPTNYYLKDDAVANYFAKFLIDSFGPYKADAKYRPFGNEAIDGFDLDIEANASELPSSDLISAHYATLVNELKRLQPSILISAAPQCQIPDPRLADAIHNAKFDMIFTQFYNTDECSARRGITDFNKKDSETGFTFGKWADWLVANSKNSNVKLYMGLSASKTAANSAHYLEPAEASALIRKWKAAKPNNFGGVMLWAHTQSSGNKNNCRSYHYWVKTILEAKESWTKAYNNGCSVSSSSIRPSSTLASSSVRPSSTPVSSSARVSSSAIVSSSVAASSSVVPSATVSSSVAVSVSSGIPSPTATITSPDGNCGPQPNGLAYNCKGYNFGSCCSQYGYCGGEVSASNPREAYCGTGCNPLYGDCDGISSSLPASSSVAASSSAVASSSAIISSSAVSSAAPSSAVVSSSAVSSVASSSAPISSAASSSAVSSSAVVSSAASSSAPVSSAASSSAASSSVVASSSAVVSSVASSSAPVSSAVSSSGASSVASSSAVISSAASSSAVVPSSSVISSVYNVSSSDISSAASSSVYVVRTTGHSPLPTGGSSVYPTFSAPYPIHNVSSTHGPYYPPADASSTPCSTSTKPVVASSKPGYPEYSASMSKPGYPEKPASTPCTTSSKPVIATSSSKPSYPEYPASSKPSYPEYPVQSKPSYPEYPVSSKPSYPEVPASSATTKVITTTYVDSCETGLTTKTETITKTICNKCTKPTEDSVTSIYVCKNCGPSVVTVTITKPNTPATGVPAKPTGPVYGGDNKSQPPAQPSKPSGPSYGNDKPNQPVYSADVKKQNDATSTTVQIVYVTKTPVPVVPASTPILYPSGPAKNGTSGYPTKPVGTGVPTKPTGTGVPTKPTYAPPQFTGAASRMGAGITGVLAIVAGLLVL